MMVTHVMLDLETWGTEPGCDIRSIGACLFVPHTGAVCTPDHIQTDPAYPQGTFYIATDNPDVSEYSQFGQEQLKYPLHRDPRTAQWRSEQSGEAQAAFTDPVDLRDALLRFGIWVQDFLYVPPADGVSQMEIDGSQLRLWSHGPAFDPPILAAAYRAVGLTVPWHYRAPRDTRTAFDLAGIDDHSNWLKQHPGPLGIPHHALDDAICQARAVCAAWSIIRTEREVFDAQAVVPPAPAMPL